MLITGSPEATPIQVLIMVMITRPLNKPWKATFSAQNNKYLQVFPKFKFPNLVLDSIVSSALSSHKPEVTEHCKRSMG